MALPLLWTSDGEPEDRVVRVLTADHSRPIGMRLVTAPSSAPVFDHVIAQESDLGAPVGGFYYLTTGSWAFTAPMTLALGTLRINAGQTVYMHGLGWRNVISTQLTNNGTLIMDNVAITYTTGFAVQADGETFLINCRLQVPNAGANNCLQIGPANAAYRCIVLGGRMVNGMNSIGIDNTIDTVQLVCVQAGGSTVFLNRTGGTVGACIVSGCAVSSGTGINWALASLPTRGLLVTGCDLNCAVPYAGHVPGGPSVNYKCNTDAAGIMSETPIIP